MKKENFILLLFCTLLNLACSEGGNNHTVSDTHLKKTVYSSQDELNKAAQKKDPKALYTLASTYATNSTDVEDQKKLLNYLNNRQSSGMMKLCCNLA